MARIRVVCPRPVEHGGFTEFPKPRVFAVLNDGTEEELQDVVRLFCWAEVGEAPGVMLELVGVELDVVAEQVASGPKEGRCTCGDDGPSPWPRCPEHGREGPEEPV